VSALRRYVPVALLAVGLVRAPLVRADDAAPPSGGARADQSSKPKRKVPIKKTVKEGVKTGAYTARDGVVTFGRATRSFFKGGPKAAKKTWNENAAKTKRTAREGAQSTRDAAHQ
jgi:hypothetical protein